MASRRNSQFGHLGKFLSAVVLGGFLIISTSLGAQAIGTPPSPPTSLSASVTGSTVFVFWNNSTDTNFDTATITASPGGATCTGSFSSCSFTNLTPGISYTFTGVSNSSDGSGPSGPSSPSNSVSFIGVPTPPLALTASEVNGQTTVSWSAPYSTGGTPLLSYLVTASNGATCSVAGTVTSCTFSGLTAGSSYSFAATATNAQGSSVASNAVTFVVPLANTGATFDTTLLLSISLFSLGLLAFGLHKFMHRLPITSHK
ncbi:fibronectin type III domain-containing protein [Aurantimicrobium sp.]|uniref:fibronectin type III domain-containing protein n=1 Tax=Aurantimicrobium sp. TaxID=1930784 RepID=UPI002FC67641